MRLFIDTNIFLSLYRFTKDELEELDKLRVLLHNQRAELYLTQQVADEFIRNRAATIADAINLLKQQELKPQFPQVCKDYPQYSELRTLQDTYNQTHKALLAAIIEDARQGQLAADRLINSLFKEASHLERTDAVLERARIRHEIGNPPGKRDSIGDAINWESLLANVPTGQDLYVITADTDYFSPPNYTDVSEFIVKEWRDLKQSRIFFYKGLSYFFREHFPQTKLAADLEKKLLIEELASSGSFAHAHGIIDRLTNVSTFNTAEMEEIFGAFASFAQIADLLRDEVARDFLGRIIRAYVEQKPEVVDAVSQEMNRAAREGLSRDSTT